MKQKYLYLIVFLFISLFSFSQSGVPPAQLQPSPYENGVLRAAIFANGNWYYKHDIISPDSIFLRNDTIFLKDGTGFVKLFDNDSTNEIDVLAWNYTATFAEAEIYLLSDPTTKLEVLTNRSYLNLLPKDNDSTLTFVYGPFVLGDQLKVMDIRDADSDTLNEIQYIDTLILEGLTLKGSLFNDNLPPIEVDLSPVYGTDEQSLYNDGQYIGIEDGNEILPPYNIDTVYNFDGTHVLHLDTIKTDTNLINVLISDSLANISNVRS